MAGSFDHSNRVQTADGRVWAEVLDASEYAMGSATRGTLRTSSGFVRRLCSPAMALRADGKFLAFSQLTPSLQYLKVLRLSDNVVTFQAGPCGVIEIDLFEQDRVTYYDHLESRRVQVTVRLKERCIFDFAEPPKMNAWSFRHRVESADRKAWADVAKANEIGMGSPTMGTLRTSSGFVRDGCNPSMAMRPDGQYLAFVEWQDREHLLKVLRLSDNAIICETGPYPVIEVEAFNGNTVSFIASPAHMPQAKTLTVDGI